MKDHYPSHYLRPSSPPPVRRTTPLQWAVGLILLAGLGVVVWLVFG